MVEDAVLWLTVFCAVRGLYRAVGAFKTKVSVTLTDGRVLVGVLMAVDRHNAIALPHVATCCHMLPHLSKIL